MHTRSEPLPYDGLANGGYAVSAQSGSKRPLNNPNRILIKKVTSLYNYEIKLLNYIKLYHIIMFKVGMMNGGDSGLLAATCGSCANGGCCVS